MWDGIYVVHQTLGKGTYFIKSYQDNDSRLKRVHGNRLNLYQLHDVFWNQPFDRILGDDLSKKKKEKKKKKTVKESKKLIHISSFTYSLYKQYTFNKMANSSNQFMLDEYTWLDTDTLTLSTVVNNKIVEKQSLFEDTSEWSSTENLNINHHPFFYPTQPFIMNTDDSQQVLLMSTPRLCRAISLYTRKTTISVRTGKKKTSYL
ncbi:uncharacterized protein BX664DRAFT_10945 [Halteromyces radiatus]|uniref:uncharacterized protein n=1 Tax=Halteromyces radiatus TaxID=101107 RepID=UPI00221E4069|nr:uncharacterized protein BX664DRAFT_10945 [Halteromyces radiatus]KAI8098994.1 hypothetical protein BX664DRAFT_10945 [Halteromyces radiatus]